MLPIYVGSLVAQPRTLEDVPYGTAEGTARYTNFRFEATARIKETGSGALGAPGAQGAGAPRRSVHRAILSAAPHPHVALSAPAPEGTKGTECT
jgi:hypothetical protein